jgi:hypothetical protein
VHRKLSAHLRPLAGLAALSAFIIQSLTLQRDATRRDAFLMVASSAQYCREDDDVRSVW